jgi:hypothetical protein
MQHEFVILKDGELKTYHNFDDIPMEFDNVIKFRPYVSEGPHTEEDHNEIDTWNDKLKELMNRERK